MPVRSKRSVFILRALVGRAAWRVCGQTFLSSLGRAPGWVGAPQTRREGRARAREGVRGAVATAGRRHVEPAAVQKTVIERSAAAIETTTIHGAAAPRPPRGASVPG